VEAGAYEGVDLIPRKIYEVLPDAEAEALGQFRVVDESGEDYLFPAGYFRMVALPPGVHRLFRVQRAAPRSGPRSVARDRRP
jgi:hypothetical protein